MVLLQFSWRRGLLYYFLEKYDNVIQDFQTYVELVPTKAEAYRMLQQ